jgi:hypothetical protein
MKNSTLINALIIGVVILIVVMLFFPLFSQGGTSTNTIYPKYTNNSIIIAPQGCVFSNVSGPSNATDFVYFNLSHDGVISGKWSSNNATALIIFPYTTNKSILRSEFNNITADKTVYSDSGSFNNITLSQGKYFIIIGPNPNHNVRVVAVTPIIITYT